MPPTSKKAPLPKSKAQNWAKSKKQSRRIDTPTLVGMGILAVLVILVIVVVATQPKTAAAVQIEGVQTYSNLDRSHTTETVNYNPIPPVGGAHNATWQNCGIYTAPVTNEYAVHSLEHGAVWITYQEGLPSAELAKLQTLTRQGTHRLLSPYPGLTSPIVASAWGYQLKLDSADDPRLVQFINAYEENPRGPEPGAPCSDGVGEPG